MIPGADLAQGRHVSNGVMNLWAIDNVFQEALFYWMVIDIVDTFYIEWSSALSAAGTKFCQDNASFLGSTEAYTINGGPDFGVIQIFEVEYKRGPISQNDSIVGVPVGAWFGALGMDIENIDALKRTATVHLIAIGPNGETIGSDGPTSLPPGETTSLMVAPEFRGPGTVQFLLKVDPSFAMGRNVLFTVQGIGL